MKVIITVFLFIFLFAACTNKAGSKKNVPNTQKEMGDTDVEKDLDTASEILGNGVVHP